jgi:hypothetical protein
MKEYLSDKPYIVPGICVRSYQPPSTHRPAKKKYIPFKFKIKKTYETVGRIS